MRRLTKSLAKENLILYFVMVILSPMAYEFLKTGDYISGTVVLLVIAGLMITRLVYERKTVDEALKDIGLEKDEREWVKNRLYRFLQKVKKEKEE